MRSIVLIAEMKRGVLFRSAILIGAVLLALVRVTAQDLQIRSTKKDADRDATADNAVRLAAQGRHVFALIRSEIRRSGAIRSSFTRPSRDPSWAGLVPVSALNWLLKLG